MFRDGTPPHHDLLFVLLATGGAACLVYSGASMAFPGWAAQYEPQLWLCGGGLVPFVLFLAGGWREWQRLGAQVDADKSRTKERDVQTAVRAWELKQAQRAAAVASGREGAREAEALERAWQIGLEILFRAIDKAGGASGRKLAGVVGSDTHPALMAFYCSPAGLCILRDAGGNVGHTWGYKADGQEWALEDVLPLIKAGSLPHPDGAVPEINPLPDSAAQRKAPRQSATQKKAEIIEGSAREVGR